jgi:hypothetical protein
VLSGSLPDITERLARAGFAVVSVQPASDDVEVVLDAVGRGVLGVETDSYALVQPGPDGSIAVSRAVGGVRLSGATVSGVDGLVQWLAKHHV